MQLGDPQTCGVWISRFVLTLKALCPEADEQALAEMGRVEWRRRKHDMPERAAASYASEKDLGMPYL